MLRQHSAVAHLIEGMDAKEAVKRLEGIRLVSVQLPVRTSFPKL